MQKRIVGNFVIILTFFLILFFHILHIQTKTVLGIAEFDSIGVSNNSDYFKNKKEEIKGTYTGKQLRQKFLIGHSGDMFSDIKTLYFNHIDPTHTNFYYSILRVSLFNLKSTDLNYLVFRGTILNLLCLIISFFFMYKLLSQIYSDKIFVSFSLFIVFLSKGLLINIIRIREYSMQMMFAIIFTYILFLLYNQIKSNTFKITKKLIFSFSMISALTMLCGYFSIIFIFFCYLFLVFLSKKYKNEKILKFLGINFVLTIFLIFLICPHYALGFLSANNKLMMFHSLEKAVVGVLSVCNKSIFTNSFVYLLIVIFAFIYKNNKNIFSKKLQYNDEFIIEMFIISCLYLVVITLLNPGIDANSHRQYIFIVVPYLILIIPYFCCRIKYKNLIIFVFALLFSVNVMKMCKLTKFVKSGFNCSAIKKENIYDNAIKNKNKKVQIITNKNKNFWREKCFVILHFDENRTYIINPKNIDLKNTYIITFPQNNYNNTLFEHFKVSYVEPKYIYIFESND